MAELTNYCSWHGEVYKEIGWLSVNISKKEIIFKWHWFHVGLFPQKVREFHKLRKSHIKFCVSKVVVFFCILWMFFKRLQWNNFALQGWVKLSH